MDKKVYPFLLFGEIGESGTMNFRKNAELNYAENGITEENGWVHLFLENTLRRTE